MRIITNEEFNFKNRYIHFFILRYLGLKQLKNKEINKKICHICHNFNNIPCYVMSELSLKRFYFALFEDGLILKTLTLAFIGFLIQTLQVCEGSNVTRQGNREGK